MSAEPAPAASSTETADRVPARIKVFYAAPYIAELAVGLPIYIWLPKFYADHLLVPLGLMAMAIAVARATDAITDPLMGWISDRTRTRWGRRRPYILVGGLMAPVFYVMLFSPPESLSPTEGALWFAAGFTSLFLFATINGVPMQALGVELTSDYHERARLFGVRAAFIMGGTLAGASLPWLVDGGLGLPVREAMPLVAIGVAAVIWTLKILLVTQVRERPELSTGSHPPLVPGVRQAFRNRPFRQLLFAYLVATLSHGMASVLLPFFIEHVLHEPDASRLLSLSLGTGFLVAIASLPLVIRASRRFGKLQVWRAALVLASATDIAKWFLAPGDGMWLVVLYGVRGVALAAMQALPAAIFADAIDYDELYSGRRREAQYSAFWHIVPKFVAVPGAAIPLAVMGTFGYVSGQTEQSPEVVLGLRAIMVVPSFLAHFAGAMMTLGYPLSSAVHGRLLHALRLRRAGESTTDPITGQRLSATSSADPGADLAWLDALSLRELRRALDGAARSLPARVMLRISGAAALTTLGAAIAIVSAGDLARKPGIAAVGGILLVGVGLTATLYHAARLRPARRVAAGEVKPASLARHIEQIELRRAAERASRAAQQAARSGRSSPASR